MLEYKINTQRIDHHESQATCKNAKIILDTDVNGRQDAFNPAELLLAALLACLIKNIERVSPIINFEYSKVQIKIKGHRHDKPPEMHHILNDVFISTEEIEKKLQLLPRNIKQYGTVYNTIASGCEINGRNHIDNT